VAAVGPRFGRRLSADDVRERWAEVQATQQVPISEPVSFIGFVKGSKTDASGELEVTIHIPLAQKANALRITDAPGTMLLFDVMPKPRRGE
jgi:hypothetical protein